ncbi:hypothetical protein EV668_0318 [Enterovirga rhinocerotis]|uniref:Uncharacterized protein n=1 Tax=Enterovirga rhinocerotis TaxID=1339210 RepID=A0A4R7C3U4_9HYPH|nr:hypothetical protein EV668_0318 [Enterovirga rhinocerotis]
MGTYSDDDVGKPILKDDGRQSEAQRQVLGEAGHETGQPEPKTPEDWENRGATAPTEARQSVPGGSSQGTGDRRQSVAGDRAAPGRPTGQHPQPKPGEG